MAKGGGRPKGRPRKFPILTPPRPVISGMEEAAESSDMAELRGMLPKSPIGEGSVTKEHIELEIHSLMSQQADTMIEEGKKEAEVQKIEERDPLLQRRRGMSLAYVAPILKQGIPTAQLQVDEIENETEKWKDAVILYVIGESPTITFLKSYLQTQCGNEENFNIFYHNEGYFVVKYGSREVKEKLLFEGPYMIASRPVIVKDWRADFCLKDEVLKEIPLWVRLPNLPLNCWSGDSLSRIGSVVGKPICADECTSLQSRISYARLLVEVDVTKPLVYKIPVVGENGLELLQQVYYEWVPLFCQKCQKVGHLCRENKREIEKHIQQVQKWIPKEKEKEEIGGQEKESEIWQQPKHIVHVSIQVGKLHVPTDNLFHTLHDAIEGGDLIPSSIT